MTWMRWFRPGSSDADRASGHGADLSLLPPPPIWSRVLIWALGSGSLALLAWSVLVKVEETVVLSGEITTAKPEVQVAAVDPGLIREILVRPHQSVQAGDPLLVYGDDETSLRLQSVARRLALLDQQRANEHRMYELRIRQNEQQVSLDRELLARLERLLASGAIQEAQVLEKRAQVVKGGLLISSLQEEKQRAVHQAEQTAEELRASERELLAKSRRFVVKAPVSGFIQQLRYQAPGERIQAAEVVATIIPQFDLIARVRIPSRLSAPVQVKDEASVDVDAFPATDYGSIRAEVASLSPMTVSSSGDVAAGQKLYSADLRLLKPANPARLHLDQLRPGMAITARMRLRERPVITTVFDFLAKLFDPLTQQR